MWSLPEHSIVEPSGRRRLDETFMVNTQCEREDCLFILVSPTWRRAAARCMSARTSSGELTGSSVRFMTKTPRPFFLDGSSTRRSSLDLALTVATSSRSQSRRRSHISSL